MTTCQCGDAVGEAGCCKSGDELRAGNCSDGATKSLCFLGHPCQDFFLFWGGGDPKGDAGTEVVVGKRGDVPVSAAAEGEKPENDGSG